MKQMPLIPLVISLSFFACKAKKRSEHADTKAAAASEPQKQEDLSPKANPIFKEGDKLLKDETLSPENEYKSYKDSIAKYKKSEDYKKPKTEVDKVVNTLADGADRVSKKDYVDLVSKGDCKKYRDRIENNIGTIEAAANIIHHEVTGKEAADDQDSDPSEPLTSHAAKTKSPLLQGTGIALVVFGSLGFIGQLGVTAGVAVGKARAIRKNAANPLQTHEKAAIGVAEAAAFGLNLWPIIVGSLIVANDETDKRLVNAAKANLIYGSILPFLVTIVSGVFSVAAFRQWRKALQISQGYIPVDPNSAGYRSSEQDRVREASGATEGFVDPKLKAKAIASGVLSIAAFSLGTGLAIWASKLELADEKLAPKEELLAKTGRALVACSMMAEKKQ